MPPTIRPAESRDVKALALLLSELFMRAARGRPDLFRLPRVDDLEERFELEQYVAERLRSPTEVFLVAEENDVALGLVQVQIERVPEAVTVPYRRAAVEGWILHIVVGQPHRRHGLGRALDQAARAWARERGAESIGLQVWTYNDGAARFFEHLGYRVRSTRLYGPC